MTIAIGSDHAGFALKETLKSHLRDSGHDVVDFGPDSEERVDYPDYAHPLAESVGSGKQKFGILICGSGNGISMAANKHPGIRAALCWNPEVAALARAHNDANILSLPARFINTQEAIAIADRFLREDFEGGRHTQRITKIPLKHE